VFFPVQKRLSFLCPLERFKVSLPWPKIALSKQGPVPMTIPPGFAKYQLRVFRLRDEKVVDLSFLRETSILSVLTFYT